MHEPQVPDHIQAGRLLPRRACAAGLHPIPQRAGHGHLDLGGTWSVSFLPPQEKAEFCSNYFVLIQIETHLADPDQTQQHLRDRVLRRVHAERRGKSRPKAFC